MTQYRKAQTATTPGSTGRNAAVREREAAAYIALSPAYLRAARLGRCDGPTYIRAGRAVRYLISDLDDWLSSRRVTS